MASTGVSFSVQSGFSNLIMTKTKSQKQRAKASKKNGNGGNAKAEGPVQAAPVAQSRKQRNRAPKIAYAVDGSSCRVMHRERIGTILGSVAFATNAFAINPGLFASFPWLSALAQRFESYRFRSLKFQFRTKSATTGTGDVILAVDYDAAEAAPVTSIQAEAYKSSVSCAPWQDIDWIASAADLHKLSSNYVRSGAIAANLDIKTYDIGNLFVCTENQGGATLVGYMYVEYEIDFMTPELSADAAPVSYAARITGASSQTAANPFGTNPTVDAQSVGFSMDATSTLTIAVAGTYVCTTKYTGTTITAVTCTAGANATVAIIAGMAEVLDGAATNGVDVFSIITTVPNATVAFTATAATITVATLVVAKVPTGVLV